MLTELKACYSPQDLIFIIALFVLAMTSVGAFVVLITHAFKGVIGEVKDIKERNKQEP
ncbi:MAG: hypothetical protein RLZZ196_1761 [Bacteroidota bacterium]|jgi:hypothetical protein